MSYDDVIPLLGNFGKYQKRIYFLLCLPAILCAFHKLINVFLEAKPDFRCRLPYEEANATYSLSAEAWNASYPYNLKADKYHSCFMYDFDGNVIKCNNGYIFDTSVYTSSVLLEWNLLCDRGYLKAVTDAIFMLGVMLGSIGFGELSDRIGRKITFFISLVIQVVVGVFVAMAPEFWSFTVARCIIGATTSGVFLVAYVIAMEMVGPKDRLKAGVICQLFFSFGYILTALFAYYIKDWRMLQLTLTLPGALFLWYWWVIPESARWLISKNKIVEAKKTIQTAAKVNNVRISDDELDGLLLSDIKKDDDKTTKKATIFDIFRHPNLRKRSLIIFFDWFAISMTYYGLSWNTSNLGANDYINFVIAGAVEFPGYSLLLLTLNRVGRKVVLCWSMIIAGAGLLTILIIPEFEHQKYVVIGLAMLGKLSITSSYGTVYIFSVEQFPTVIRNAGLGAASTSARIGSVCAPIINYLAEIWKPLPLIVYGVLTLTGGIISLVLPETLNRELPETIEDGENFGKKSDADKGFEEIALHKVVDGGGVDGGGDIKATNGDLYHE